MKLSLNWLKEYVDLPADPKQIANLITAHVAEVETIHYQAAILEGIILGKIISIRKHANADKLWVCEVDLGSEIKQIVCGGSNLVEQQLVAVAKPGAKVRWHGQADLVAITDTTIRGEQSSGMICAAVEIGLENLFPTQSNREIMDLTSLNQPIGTALSAALHLDDVIIEIDNKTLTHRPDLFCHIGFARELAVILRQPLKLPALVEQPASDRLPFTVTIAATGDCRRYCGVVLDHIKIAPSPDWLQHRLISLGLRPINNVVDITNYVMYEYGQPLHAFDYDKLAGQQIIVRRAKPGETLITLDQTERQLTDAMLVIADQAKPVALAGIMGGLDSEITEHTTTVAIESANFNPTTIRLGAQALGIRTDGSTRHEKNLPQVFPELGLWRAITLLQELADGTVASPLIDTRNYDQPKPIISLDLNYVRQLIGVEVTLDEVTKTLTNLGCAVTMEETVKRGILQITPPAHRTDLLIPEELIEEIARIYGYSNITPQPLMAKLEPQPIEPTYALASQLVKAAARAGAYEVMNYSFYSQATAERFQLPLDQHTAMLNPMNPDQALLRTSLRPNLVLTAERNLDHGERDFTLVEYGHIYPASGEQAWFGITAGGTQPTVLRIVKGYLQQLGLPTTPVRLDQVGKWFIATAELSLTQLAAQPTVGPKIVLLPEFPNIELDISVSFPEPITWDKIEPVIRQAGQPLLSDVSVFDVYETALGIRFTLQAADRTLTMDEAEQVRHTIVTALHKQFNATHRY